MNGNTGYKTCSFVAWKKSLPRAQTPTQAQRKVTRKNTIKEEPKEHHDGEKEVEEEPKKGHLEVKKSTRSVVKQVAPPAQESNTQEKTQEADSKVW